MSKNTLKTGQKRREEKQKEEEGQSTGGAERLRDELLKAEARDEQPTKRLNAEIPARLHERFKAACQSEGKSMTTVLTQLVETYTDMKGNE
jgi:TPP-dependent pyruvate/acetoin dehydrogenase alpha subunit